MPPDRTAKRAKVYERYYRLYGMVLAGASYAQVASQENTSTMIVKRAVDWAMEQTALRHMGPATEKLRAFYTARYERLLLAIWPNALSGNMDAMDRVVTILAHLRKINGVDIPERIVHELNARVLAFLRHEGVVNVETSPAVMVMSSEERLKQLLPMLRQLGQLPDELLDQLRATPAPPKTIVATNGQFATESPLAADNS